MIYDMGTTIPAPTGVGMGIVQNDFVARVPTTAPLIDQ